MITPFTTEDGRRLLSELELEVSYQRDLVNLIAEHLNEIYPDDIAARSGTDFRIAKTLAFVARDRIDAAYKQMNAAYGIEEAAQ